MKAPAWFERIIAKQNSPSSNADLWQARFDADLAEQNVKRWRGGLKAFLLGGTLVALSGVQRAALAASMTVAQLLSGAPAAPLTGVEGFYGTQGGVDKGILLSQVGTYIGNTSSVINVFNYMNATQQANVIACNGSSDVTTPLSNAIAAIPSTGGVLLIPPGLMPTTGGFTLANPFTVMGWGGCTEANLSPYKGISTIQCTSTTAVLFTVTATLGKFQSIALINTTTSTAGSAVVCNSASMIARCDFYDVSTIGFYDAIDIKVGAFWVMLGCHIMNFFHNGVNIANTVNVDDGDWCIDDCNIFGLSPPGTSASGILITSAGGGKIMNTKIQLVSQGITLTSGGVVTSQLLVNGCDIEGITGAGIKVNSGWPYLVFNNNYIRGGGIQVATSGAVVISGNVFVGTGTSQYPIQLTSVAGATIGPNQVYQYSAGFQGVLYISGNSAVLDVSTYSVAFAQLPPTSAMVAGSRGFVNDATTATFGATVSAGGGSNKVPVVFDGTNWIVG